MNLKNLNYLIKIKNGQLFISHTFSLKLLLIYMKMPELFDNRGLIYNFINPKKKIMEFGEILYNLDKSPHGTYKRIDIDTKKFDPILK